MDSCLKEIKHELHLEIEIEGDIGQVEVKTAIDWITRKTAGINEIHQSS
jgi:hypothetical protein